MPTDLRDEIRQTRPFTSLEHEALLSIARTAAMLEHVTADTLKEYGLTPTQFNVLRILRGAGAEGLCRGEVRDRMIASVPDTTRLLDRMEVAGLVQRERDNPDRRFVTTRISEEGLRVLSELDEPMKALDRRLMGVLNKGDLKELVRMLGVLRESIREDQPG
jgi:DNA-binding MarR family transcriptional regulator